MKQSKKLLMIVFILIINTSCTESKEGWLLGHSESTDLSQSEINTQKDIENGNIWEGYTFVRVKVEKDTLNAIISERYYECLIENNNRKCLIEIRGFHHDFIKVL